MNFASTSGEEVGPLVENSPRISEASVVSSFTTFSGSTDEGVVGNNTTQQKRKRIRTDLRRGVVKGNNPFGSKGRPRCAACRRVHFKCSYTSLDEDCYRCRSLGIKCGEKQASGHWRSSRQLSESQEFIENFQILEQAHERIAWVHELSALPNLSCFGNGEWKPREQRGQNEVSVQEEVASLLSEHYPLADRGVINSVVGEEIQRYRETNAEGNKLTMPLHPLKLAPIVASDITAEPVDTEDNGKETYPQNTSIEFADPPGSILTVMPPLIDSTRQVRYFNIPEDASNTGPFQLELPFQMPVPLVDSPGETIYAFSQMGMSQFRLDSQEYPFILPGLETTCFCLDPCSCPVPSGSGDTFGHVVRHQEGQSTAGVVLGEGDSGVGQAIFSQYWSGAVVGVESVSEEGRGTKRKRDR